MISQLELKRTPLFEEHIKLNAKMVPFGGWEMPVQYEGIISEYNNTRQTVSVFDISHMGEFIIEGDPVETGLDNIVTPSIVGMSVKSCRYGAMLNDKGGVIDDLVVFRLDRNKWMVVVNAATIEKDALQFKEHITSKGFFRDISDDSGKLDVQGPKSREILSSIVDGIDKLDYYTFDYFDVMGENVVVSRTGYTGELGYEIYFPSEKIAGLWSEILLKGVKPAGLGARDVLRLEMGYSLYGHELSEEISLLDAGLGRFVCWEKEFIGKQSLLKLREEGARKNVVCLVSCSRRSPRNADTIFTQDKKEIGFVTSGSFSPSLQKGIGLGFVDKGFDAVGEKISVGDEKGSFSAEIVKRPIYRKGSLKS